MACYCFPAFPLRLPMELHQALYEAVLAANVSKAQSHVAAGADANWKPHAASPSMLAHAAAQRSLDLVDMLLQAGARVSDTFDVGAGMANIRCQVLSATHALLLPVWRIAQAGSTPLHAACAVPHNAQVVRLLLRHGGRCSAIDAVSTAASIAARSLQCVYACPTSQATGQTALHVAAVRADGDTVRALVAAGADMHCGDKVLSHARAHAAPRPCPRLLGQPNLLACKQNGDSPLHLACRENHLPALHALLSLGSRVQAQSTVRPRCLW